MGFYLDVSPDSPRDHIQIEMFKWDLNYIKSRRSDYFIIFYFIFCFFHVRMM